MKMATAFKIKNKIFIQSLSRTTAGIWVLLGTVYVFEDTEEEQAKYSVLSALGNSNYDAPHPDQDGWQSILKPMLGATGQKSWKNLINKSKAVSIIAEGNSVKLTPSAVGNDFGRADLPDQALVANLTDNNLGEILISAFLRCR